MKMASIPATNTISMAANNATNDAQMNFNPSWMQSTAPPMQRSLSVSNSNNAHNNNTTNSAPSNAKKNVFDNDETCEPIFAKHRYGREDLLAMMGKNSLKPPHGIKRCPFFVDTAQTPIILTPFSDTEMRLQQNMNSSKAMSSKKKSFNRADSSAKGTDIWPRRTAGGGGALAGSGGGGAVGSNNNANDGGCGGNAGGAHHRQKSQTPPALTTPVVAAAAAPVKQQQSPKPVTTTASSTDNTSANTTAATDAQSKVNNRINGTIANGNTSTTPMTGSGAPAANHVTAKEPSLSGHAVKNQPSSTTGGSTAAVGSSKGTSASGTSAHSTSHFWFYLDPSGMQRGPFDSHQMQAWFSSGYFSETLQVRRKEETAYTTLGDLFLINSREKPFTAREGTSSTALAQKPSLHQQNAVAAAFPTVQQRISPSDLIESITTHHPHISPNLESVQRIWATTPLEEATVGGGAGGGTSVAATAPAQVAAPASNIVVGGPVGSTTVGGSAGSTTAMTMLQNKELQLLEEQRKLREKEELLRRDELDRAEKERRMREMEAELKRQQEELSRRAREKEAEFDQRYAQMVDYERKRRDELASLEQRIRTEHLQHQLRLEEEDRRRAKELEELLRREQERQHQLVEAEVKRKREEEELRLRLALQERQHQQELIREKARRAEEEQRRRLIEEQRRQLIEEQHLQQLVEEQRRLQLMEEQQQKQHQPAVTEQRRGWQPVQMPTPAPIPPAIAKQQQHDGGLGAVGTQKTHVGSNKKQQNKQQQQQSEQHQPAVTEQRRGWQPVQLPKPAPIPPAIAKQQQHDGGLGAVGAQKTHAVSNKKQQNKQQPEQVPPVEDKFTAWIIKRVKALNPSVDAEVFATFISGIDSPNEAEDYIIGYLGEKKEVKEFHRDFLQKRIELRPRAHQQAPKDDLSRPAAALGADSEQHHKGTGGGWASGGANCGATMAGNGATAASVATTMGAPNAAQNNNNKKKKGGQKGQKVLDPATLGFRPASDPNRVNAGEIDSVPPAPVGNKKR